MLAFEEEETLESLLEASRTPEGRSRLAASGAVASVLRGLRTSSSPSSLLSRLRLLRNLCAGEPANQNSFVDRGGPDAIASVLFGPPPHPAPASEILRAGLQLLGNIALAGEPHRSAVWARFFPASFLELARVPEPAVCDPLCMVLDTCLSMDGGRARLEEICRTSTGLPILVEIVITACQVGYKEEWLEWLLFKVCVEEERFSVLFAALSSSAANMDTSHGGEFGRPFFDARQAFLLCVLSKCLSERPKEVTVSKGYAFSVMEVMKSASTIVDSTSRGCSSLPTGSPAIDVLGYSLLILRDTSAWEGDPLLPAIDLPIDSLVDAGLMELLLTFLRDLEPPAIVRKSMTKEQVMQPLAAKPPNVCPYQGYRRDLVSIIANCLHGRKRVQDEVRRQNGILLLLQQCVVDEENPFLREWGLLAVRNLLEGNAENQKEVAELELQGPVVTPEISQLGLRVEVDKENGRARLINIS